MKNLVLCGLLVAAGCGGAIDGGASVSTTEEGLSGCHGHASSTIPSSGDYYLTSFGGGSDTQSMSCGGTADGTWYYAASKQRFGCGARIQIEANGKCVVAETEDYGPDVCVENAAGRPIIDASPLVSEHLFGSSSAGWSDRFPIHVTQVDASTPLGPCNGSTPAPPAPPPPTGSGSCHSGTLDKDVPAGTCIQSASDANWYHCSGGSWLAGESGCTTTYAYCHSSTLGRNVPARTCVQSIHDSVWYQCGADGWDSGVSGGAGPTGTCSAMYSL
jgi:hypothetical protein